MEREEKNKLQNLPTEAFDYVQYSLRRYHNHQLNGCLHMDGRIEENRLQHAVSATFEELPQLCATFINGGWRKTEEKKLFQVQVSEGTYKKEDISSFFAETHLLQEPFQVKVRIFRQENKDTIAIVFNHMLCDGMDFKQYLYLLCERYNSNGEKQEGDRNYSELPRDISWVQMQKGKRRPWGKKPKRERIPMEEGKIPCFLHETMPADKFARICAYAKEHDVAVEDYFLAGYYQAIAKVFDYKAKSICCTEDVRRYCSNALGLSNQTGNRFCTVKEAEKLSFEELIQAIKEQRSEEQENGYCLKQIRRINRVTTHLPQRISSWLIDEMETSPKIMFTNLGTIEEEKLIFGGVEPEGCYITEPLKRASNLQITASAYKGSVTFSINMMVSEKNKVRLTYFLQIYYVCLMEEVVPTFT